MSIREKPANPYARRKRGADGDDKADGDSSKPADKWEFFVHWDTFNKRLDGWVAGSRLVLTRDLEWPRPKPPPGKKNGATNKAPSKVPRTQSQPSLLKKATSNAAKASHQSTPTSLGYSASSPNIRLSASPGPSSLKRKAPHDDEEMELDEDEDPDADAEGEMDIDDDGEGETFDLSIVTDEEIKKRMQQGEDI